MPEINNFTMPENGILPSEEKDGLKRKKIEKKWFAIYTRPRAEKQVFERLTEMNAEVFLPLQKTYRKWSDRKKLVIKPLLSSYIFVRTGGREQNEIVKIHGIVKYISFEGKPVAIPENQINNLRLLVNSDAEIEVTTEVFDAGDKVEVMHGSLCGLTGELIKIGRQNRVIVRIDKLEQNLILKIPKSFLKKI
jgi:transcriptional antiterminator RfaH